MKQLSTLTARADFSFRPNGTGRVVNVKAGEQFETTDSETAVVRSGAVHIARLSKGKIGQGWLFSLDQIGQLFTVST